MRLDEELEIETIREEIEKQDFTIKNVSGCVNIVSPNNVTLIISKSRFNDSVESLYYLDSSLLSHYGLCNFLREWKDKDKLKKYILTICIPFVKNLGGYATITEGKIIDCIKAILTDKKIDFTFSDRLLMKRKAVFLAGDCILADENQPCFTFHRKGTVFAIYLKSTSIMLAELTSEFVIQYSYPWYSFCPVYKKGEDYVKTTICNFLEFIDNLNLVD